MGEASTQELSNIVIQDPPEDAPRMDCFREHREEHGAEAATDTFHADAALHKESMEQARRAVKAPKSQTPPKTPHAATP